MKIHERRSSIKFLHYTLYTANPEEPLYLKNLCLLDLKDFEDIIIPLKLLSLCNRYFSNLVWSLHQSPENFSSWFICPQKLRLINRKYSSNPNRFVTQSVSLLTRTSKILSPGAKIIASLRLVWTRVSINQNVQFILHDCLT